MQRIRSGAEYEYRPLFTAWYGLRRLCTRPLMLRHVYTPVVLAAFRNPTAVLGTGYACRFLWWQQSWLYQCILYVGHVVFSEFRNLTTIVALWCTSIFLTSCMSLSLQSAVWQRLLPTPFHKLWITFLLRDALHSSLLWYRSISLYRMAEK
jgi:hypothetical protein